MVASPFLCERPPACVACSLRSALSTSRLRNVLDPKRHYKKGDTKLKNLPKYFQASFIQFFFEAVA
ncbi:hypothetical protein QQ045_022591 [Rhodiola kirilowii]